MMISQYPASARGYLQELDVWTEQFIKWISFGVDCLWGWGWSIFFPCRFCFLVVSYIRVWTVSPPLFFLFSFFFFFWGGGALGCSQFPPRVSVEYIFPVHILPSFSFINQSVDCLSPFILPFFWALEGRGAGYSQFLYSVMLEILLWLCSSCPGTVQISCLSACMIRNKARAWTLLSFTKFLHYLSMTSVCSILFSDIWIWQCCYAFCSWWRRFSQS